MSVQETGSETTYTIGVDPAAEGGDRTVQGEVDPAAIPPGTDLAVWPGVEAGIERVRKGAEVQRQTEDVIQEIRRSLAVAILYDVPGTRHGISRQIAGKFVYIEITRIPTPEEKAKMDEANAAEAAKERSLRVQRGWETRRRWETRRKLAKKRGKKKVVARKKGKAVKKAGRRR